jgi:hypothetical protein
MAESSEVNQWPTFSGYMEYDEIVRDHEDNPEYEVHAGRLIKSAGHLDKRLVSIWLKGERFTGFLYKTPEATSSGEKKENR